MSCGCGAKKAAKRDRERACAVMCAVCPERVDQTCGPLDMPTRELIELRIACPHNHHPNGEGVLVWLGVKWYGVPAVIRWAWPILRRLHRWPILSGPLPGCGCLVRVKDWWEARRGKESQEEGQAKEAARHRSE